MVSIDEARRRLRGTQGLEATIARHPASASRSTKAVHRIEVNQRRSPMAVAGMLRVSLWLLVTGLVFAVALGLGLALRPAPFSGETWTHSVVSGESVWGLAQSIGSKRPLEAVVADIMTLNALGDAVLQPGQQILLPTE